MILEKKVFNRPAFLILFKKLSFFISLISLSLLFWGYVNFQTVGQWELLRNWVFYFLPSTIVTYTFVVITSALIALVTGAVSIYFYVEKYLSFIVDENGIAGPCERGVFPRMRYVLRQDIDYIGLDLLGGFVVQANQVKLGVGMKLNRFDEFYLRKLIRDANRTLSIYF